MSGTRFKEILRFAITEENNAALLYSKYAAVVASRSASVLLESMAAMEYAHREKLENFVLKNDKEISLTKVIPDFHLSDFMADSVITSRSSIEDVFVFAIKAEANAEKLYTTLASVEADRYLKTLFSNLAQEEKKHKLDLENIYEREFMKDN
jgi:rubrerythrin